MTEPEDTIVSGSVPARVQPEHSANGNSPSTEFSPATLPAEPPPIVPPVDSSAVARAIEAAYAIAPNDVAARWERPSIFSARLAPDLVAAPPVDAAPMEAAPMEAAPVEAAPAEAVAEARSLPFDWLTEVGSLTPVPTEDDQPESVTVTELRSPTHEPDLTTFQRARSGVVLAVSAVVIGLILAALIGLGVAALVITLNHALNSSTVVPTH
jgi:hypothetical protein